MLCKASVKARPSVLWCYKKDLGFSSHRKKRMKQLKKKMRSGGMDVDEDNPFELFVSSTNIRYCYYSDTHKILGNTFGMCVLQVKKDKYYVSTRLPALTYMYNYMNFNEFLINFIWVFSVLTIKHFV